MNSILKQEKLLILATVSQAILAIVALSLGLSSSLESAHAPFFKQIAILSVGGALLSILSLLQTKLFRATQEEDQTTVAESIFDDAKHHSRKQESYDQFKKSILPIIIFAICAIEAGLTIWNFVTAMGAETPTSYDTTSFLIPVSACIMTAIPLFLFGKYLSGLAYEEDYTWLRPTCGNISLAGILFFLTAIICFLIKWQYFNAPLVFFYFLAILQIFLAAEKPLTWLFDLYRPKNKKSIELPCYESKILSLLSHPGGVLNSLSDMLHYQFGLRVSDNAFKAFFTKLLMPYIILQTLSMLALTSLVYIRPYENGLSENLISQKNEVLTPGFHFRLPWPLVQVERINMTKEQHISIINQRELNSEELEFAPHLIRTQERTEEEKREAAAELEIWNDLRFDRNLYLCFQSDKGKTLPALALVQANVSFHINDALLHNPTRLIFKRLLHNISQRQLSRSLLAEDISTIMRSGDKLCKTLEEKIQSECDAQKLGIKITAVTFNRLQPPPQIAADYRNFTTANEERAQKVFAARNYATRTISAVQREKDSIIKKAEGETYFSQKIKEEQAKDKIKRLKNYQKQTKLYETLAMMDSVEYWMGNTRKIIVTQENKSEKINLDLKKSQQDLLEVE